MSHRCRFCDAPLHVTFVNLNSSPLANSLLDAQAYHRMEAHYPLHALVCEECFLVQLPDLETPENIFSDYLYFSSYSDTWLAHARDYCDDMIVRFGLGRESRVVEVASNDGYLLRNFVDAGISVLGIEPAANVAEVARQKGVPTMVAFFGSDTAKSLRAEGHIADLMTANNVLAHVPDINGFVEGFSILLKPEGVATFEFPHLLNIMEQNQFDTIYHEHFSYLSLLAVERIFAAHGLSVFDVEKLSTHGGSLRVYACHAGRLPPEERVLALRAQEEIAGLHCIESYSGFAEQVVRIKCEILSFLIDMKREGRRLVAYGAPAKGNTLLNYCGIGPEFLPFTVDRNPYKQGRYLPGTRIPIRHPDTILKEKPDLILILPWNLKNEIIEQMAAVRGFGTRFVTAIPRVQVW